MLAALADLRLHAELLPSLGAFVGADAGFAIAGLRTAIDGRAGPGYDGPSASAMLGVSWAP